MIDGCLVLLRGLRSGTIQCITFGLIEKMGDC